MSNNLLKNKPAIVLSLVVIFLTYWAINTKGQLTDENNQLLSEIGYLETRVSDYEDALTEANDNIDQANSNIEDAKMYAWETYQDMGDALDMLETVDTVSEP